MSDGTDVDAPVRWTSRDPESVLVYDASGSFFAGHRPSTPDEPVVFTTLDGEASDSLGRVWRVSVPVEVRTLPRQLAIEGAHPALVEGTLRLAPELAGRVRVTVDLEGRGFPADVTSEVTLRSEPPDIVRVEPGGRVVGLRLGTAMLRTEYLGLGAALAVRVMPELETATGGSFTSEDYLRCHRYPEGIPTGASLRMRGTVRTPWHEYEIAPERFEYFVRDSHIATIDTHGVFTALAPGSTVIWARLREPPFTEVNFTDFIRVEAGTLRSIHVRPQRFAAARGMEVALEARGDFGDGATDCYLAPARGASWQIAESASSGVRVDARGVLRVESTASAGALSVIARVDSHVASTRATVVSGCVRSLEIDTPDGYPRFENLAAIQARAVTDAGTAFFLHSGVVMEQRARDGAVRFVSDRLLSSGFLVGSGVDGGTEQPPLFARLVSAAAGCDPSRAPEGERRFADDEWFGVHPAATFRSPSSVECVRTTPIFAGRSQPVTMAVAGSIIQCPRFRPQYDAADRQSPNPHSVFEGGTPLGDGDIRVGPPGTLRVRGGSNITVVDGGAPRLFLFPELTVPRVLRTEGGATVLGGSRTRLRARAVYRFDTPVGPVTQEYDVTEQSTWSSPSAAVRVSDTPGTRGLVRFAGAAQAQVGAEFAGVRATLEVAPERRVLRALRLAIDAPSVRSTLAALPGEQHELFAIGEYCAPATDASGAACVEHEVTKLCDWGARDAAVVRVDMLGGRPLLRAHARGATAVWARCTGLSAELPADVGGSCIGALDFIRGSVGAPSGMRAVGATVGLLARSLDGTSRDLTEPSSGFSSSVAVEQVGAFDTVVAAWPLRIAERNAFTLPSSLGRPIGRLSYQARFAAREDGVLCDGTRETFRTVFAPEEFSGPLISLHASAEDTTLSRGLRTRLRVFGVVRDDVGEMVAVELTADPETVWSVDDPEVLALLGDPRGAVLATGLGRATVLVRAGSAPTLEASVNFVVHEGL